MAVPTTDLPPYPIGEMMQENSEQGQQQSQTASSSSSVISQKANDESAESQEFTISTRFILAFAALAVLTLMVALDGTSISVALPVIARKLHGSAIEAFWAGTAFLLASTVFQPNFASFSHIFGRMPVIMVSIAFFFVGVIMAALSNNFGVLLAGRSIQGIGGGGEYILRQLTTAEG